jgi:hypothetical protein
MPRPEDGVDNPLGERYWNISPRVSVQPRCRGLRLTKSLHVLFNDELVSRDEGPALAGDTLRIATNASCPDGSMGFAEREFKLPPASCDAGPLRVYRLQGKAESRDWNHGDRRMDLREGDLVSPGSPLRVSKGGQIELGAPECNGMRAVLFEGENWVGGYNRGSRGDWFSGSRIFMKADRHTGRFSVPGGPRGGPRATVTPVGDLTSFVVRSFPERVIVRVYRGSALVSGSSERQRFRARAGEQSAVRCARACRATPPRIFQPREPWSSTLIRGFARLAPRFARFETRLLPATQRAPQQLLVAWSREVRRRDGLFPLAHREEGYRIWQRQAGRWRLVYAVRIPEHFWSGYQVGDVTRDGHPDVLIEESMGTADCGIRRLVATVAGRVQQVYRRRTCETRHRIQGGRLLVNEPVGPCPSRVASVHCFGGRRTFVRRWDGRLFVTVSVRTSCVLPRLDPAANCAERAPNTP